MFCSHCGKELRDGSKFCGYCGKELPTSPATEEPAPQAQTPEAPVIPAEPIAPPAAEAPAAPETKAEPAPVQVAPEAPAAQAKPEVPAPKAPKVKKEKTAKPGTFKKILVKVAFLLGLAALYTGLSLAFLLFLDKEQTVVLGTLFNSNVRGYLTFREFLDMLIDGTRIFHPTALSTALGAGMYMLIYATPVFDALALLGAATGKRVKSLCVTSSVFSILTSVMLAGIVPVAMQFVDGLRQAAAVEAGIMFQDLGAVTFLQPIVFAAIGLVLTVAAIIVTAIYNKRRA